MPSSLSAHTLVLGPCAPTTSTNSTPRSGNVSPNHVSEETRQLKMSIAAAGEEERAGKSKVSPQDILQSQFSFTAEETALLDNIGCRSATKPKLLPETPFACGASHTPRHRQGGPSTVHATSNQALFEGTPLTEGMTAPRSVLMSRAASRRPGMERSATLGPSDLAVESTQEVVAARDVASDDQGATSEEEEEEEDVSPYEPSSELLADDYNIHGGHPLGRGATSVVFRCSHKKTQDQFLAVKCVFKRSLDESSRDHLCEGINAVRNLAHHASVLPLLASYEDDDFIYLIHPLMCGGNLYDRIKKHAPSGYSERQAAAIMSKLLDGIIHLHANGIVHRDVKPENILFPGENALSTNVLLGDMGLATVLQNDDDILTSFCGSLSYASPEVLGKRGYAAATDLWSAGVVAYVLLTGRTPFRSPAASSIPSFVDAVSQQPVEFPVGTKVSEAAQSFVKSLMVKDAATRPTAAKAKSHPWILRYGGNRQNVTVFSKNANSFR